METHYLRRNCLCLLFPFLHLHLLHTLHSVLCCHYFIVMILTSANSNLLSICRIKSSLFRLSSMTSQKLLQLLTLSSSHFSTWASGALLFMSLLLLYHLICISFRRISYSFCSFIIGILPEFHPWISSLGILPPISKPGNGIYIQGPNQHQYTHVWNFCFPLYNLNRNSKLLSDHSARISHS